jgi:CRP/FNR family cyclic AMP-dependent transcriptional regulator
MKRALVSERKRKPLAPKPPVPFNPQSFLATVGSGKTSLTRTREQIVFSQGDASDAVFYLEAGRVGLTVVSQQGKEAVVAILEPGAFFGEACLNGQTTFRFYRQCRTV